MPVLLNFLFLFLFITTALILGKALSPGTLNQRPLFVKKDSHKYFYVKIWVWRGMKMAIKTQTVVLAIEQIIISEGKAQKSNCSKCLVVIPVK